MGMGPDHIINSLNELDDNLRQNIKVEAASAVEDANLYTDEQIAAIPEVELPDLSYLDELQNLAVVGNYKLIHTGDLEPGAITGRKEGNVADNLTHRWTEMFIALQDLNSYVSNNFLNVKQGWVVEFHSKKGDEVIAAKWRITGEVVRNGDTDIEFDIEAINDDSLQFDLREHTAGELYVHDGSKTPHFPVRTSRFDQLQAQIDAVSAPELPLANNYRPYSWVDESTLALDLRPGECFISNHGYLYMSIRDADGNLVMLDGEYDLDWKGHCYYRNAAGEAVELFSAIEVNVHTGTYIRFRGEEEVLKDAANSGMTHLDSPLFM